MSLIKADITECSQAVMVATVSILNMWLYCCLTGLLIPVKKCAYPRSHWAPDFEMLPGERKPKLVHTFSLPPRKLYKRGSILHSMIVFALIIIFNLAEIYFTGFCYTFFFFNVGLVTSEPSRKNIYK